MWNEKIHGSKERHEGAVRTTQSNGNRCHLTSEELECLDAKKVSAKAVEVNMPMSQAQPLISAANRLRGSFQKSNRVPGYAGFVPTNRVVDLTTVSGIMVLGGSTVSDSPEYGFPAPDKITG